MKQKLILLMVLIAGLAACSKDEDGDYYAENAVDSENIAQYGEFEGDWILDQQVIGSAILVVTDKHFLLNLPEEQLLKYALSLLTADGIVNIPDNSSITFVFDSKKEEQSEEKYASDNSIVSQWGYQLQGNSENNSYFEFDNTKLDLPYQPGYMVTHGWVNVSDENGEKHKWELAFFSNEPIVGIFNRDNQLWVIKITLNNIFYDDMNGYYFRTLQSPPVLIFVAREKLYTK